MVKRPSRKESKTNTMVEKLNKKETHWIIIYMLCPLFALILGAALFYVVKELPKISTLIKSDEEQKKEISKLRNAIIELAERTENLDSGLMKELVIKNEQQNQLPDELRMKLSPTKEDSKELVKYFNDLDPTSLIKNYTEQKKEISKLRNTVIELTEKNKNLNNKLVEERISKNEQQNQMQDVLNVKLSQETFKVLIKSFNDLELIPGRRVVFEFELPKSDIKLQEFYNGEKLQEKNMEVKVEKKRSYTYDPYPDGSPPGIRRVEKLDSYKPRPDGSPLGSKKSKKSQLHDPYPNEGAKKVQERQEELKEKGKKKS